MPEMLGRLVAAAIMAFVVLITLGLLTWAAVAIWSQVLR